MTPMTPPARVTAEAKNWKLRNFGFTRNKLLGPPKGIVALVVRQSIYLAFLGPSFFLFSSAQQLNSSIFIFSSTTCTTQHEFTRGSNYAAAAAVIRPRLITISPNLGRRPLFTLPAIPQSGEPYFLRGRSVWHEFLLLSSVCR